MQENEQKDKLMTIFGYVDNLGLVYTSCSVVLSEEGRPKTFDLADAKMIMTHLKLKCILTSQEEDVLQKKSKKLVMIEISEIDEDHLVVLVGKERLLKSIHGQCS
jgi:hypothetical protein